MKISLVATIRGDQNGSLFIGLIITMMLFAALGAAMFSFTTTSAFNQVWANSASKAYYMAESGFRYAESEYKHTGDTDGDGEIKDDRNQLLEGWNSPDSPGTPVLFTFSDQIEKFELKIYPYYLVTTASHSKNATSLQTKFPGAQPAGFTVPSPGRLKIGSDDPYAYTYNTGTGTFTINPGLRSNLSDNMDVYLIVNPSAAGTITKGGDLTLSGALFFPDRNGIFSVHGGGGRVYGYTSRSENTLRNIFDANDPDGTFADVAVLGSTDIVLNPFVKLTSIGIIEHGGSMDTKREIDYSVPLTTDTEEIKEYRDTFEDKTDWTDSSLGGHTVQTIGGDKALKVTGTGSAGGDDVGSKIEFNWSETDMDLGASRLRGDPYFLSYDTQIKVGFDPLPIPANYMAGISFRVDNDDNNYGLSFLRGGAADNIPDALVPSNNSAMIVLWQQTGDGSARTWLAYKDIERPGYLNDTVEGGKKLWTTSGVPSPVGLWHISTRKPYPFSPTRSWYYGRVATGNYDTGATNSGSLISTPINLCNATAASLSFWSWYNTEDQAIYVDVYDLKTVEVSTNCGNTWNVVYQLKRDSAPFNLMNVWQPITVNLSAYLGRSILIRFYFNTRDAVQNDHEGWYIDDVTVTSDATFQLNEASLLARVVESASITFSGGGGAAIVDGDLIVGSTSGARGRVSGAPVVASGSWAGNNAAGTLLLENVTGTFQGEALTVSGSSAVATATGFTSRANTIKAYYGNTTGCGVPNSCALDQNKRAYPRNAAAVKWPPIDPANWAAANDYFTLVQWDVAKVLGEVAAGSEVNTLKRISSLTEPKAILESTASDLLTPVDGAVPFDQPELGLHTFGNTSTSVYFDDFAVQAGIVSSGGFFPAVQD